MPNRFERARPERSSWECRQKLKKTKEGDLLSIIADDLAIEGRVINQMHGAFTLAIERPAELGGAEMDIRIGGAITKALVVPENESFFYTIRFPDGRLLPEAQSGRLREVEIVRN